ncbi:hypothetical protein Rhopal_003676-T1 [Rhodotorula paludigena]|uniref:Uncharacterized protein n=1 Tax=Rhodotorula paludigena TaxID=86838 RepID=A0AAV5GN43_9BASI|nr:hypothetical protein Rhopal_003676-T1 [Rhodotorula paludigena]
MASRPCAVPSSVHDWMGAHLPPTPAMQPCTWDHASTAPPPAPALDAPDAHCPTPVLTPDEDEVLPSLATATNSATAGLARAATVPSLSGRSSFVKRDDLTAKAVARAASLASGSQPHQPLERRYTESSLSAPAQLQQPGNDKDRFVNGLVGASVLAIESIWGPAASTSCPAGSPSASSATASGVLPLQWFVKEVLRRSRTSCSTLQLALYYLHKSRREIRDAVARADASRGEIVRLEQELKACKRAAPTASYPSPPHSPQDALDAAHAVHASALASELGERFSQLVEAQNSPVLCGRRMFLAALISASKYLQDRNYSNRAWAKISGLPVQEVNKNERAFLQVVAFQLHLRKEDFERWTARLSTLTASASASSSSAAAQQSQPQAPQQPLSTSITVSPSLLARHGLARSSSEHVLLDGSAATPLAAGARALGPLTQGARTALSRGQSSAAVLGGGVSLTSARERGFPVAQPIQQQYRQPANAVDHLVDDDDSSSSGASDYSVATTASSSAAAATPRKVRGLPTRRAHFAQVQQQQQSFVPASWTAGASAMEGVEMLGRGIEAVRAH